MIRSNFGQDLVDGQDQRIRAALTSPDSAEALIAMLLFYPKASGQPECQQHAPGLAGAGLRHAPVNELGVGLVFGPRSVS